MSAYRLRGLGDDRMMPFYRFAKSLILPVFGAFYPLKITGSRKLPEGAVIVVCNHISNWDVLVLARVFDRQLHYMAKKELFGNPILRAIINGLGAFPVDRGSADMSAIRRSLELMNAGEVVGIFPQGTRVKDDSSFEVAGGVAMIALRSHAQIVPVHINGPYRLFRRMKVNIGEPFTPVSEGTRVSKELIGQVCAEVVARVTALKEV